MGLPSESGPCTAGNGFSQEELVSEARAALTKNGEKWTAMREAVFIQLAECQQPVSAYEIADQLSQKRGKRVAPNSIYRILDVFVANNLASRIESANAFLANVHPGHRHDCIFLVCNQCGDAIHIDDERISQSLRNLAALHDFKADRPVLEMRGLCEICS